MNDNEFFLRQQDAVERMREMNSRAVAGSAGSQQSNMPPVPPFVRIPGQENSRSGNRQAPLPKHQKPEPGESGYSDAYGYNPQVKGGQSSRYPQTGNNGGHNKYTPHNASRQEHDAKARKNAIFDSEKPKEQTENNSSLLAGLNLPFLDFLKKDSDITLIIGLLLILISEKADKKLLFALIYILM